jgi:hypothetical protein
MEFRLILCPTVGLEFKYFPHTRFKFPESQRFGILSVTHPWIEITWHVAGKPPCVCRPTALIDVHYPQRKHQQPCYDEDNHPIHVCICFFLNHSKPRNEKRGVVLKSVPFIVFNRYTMSFREITRP